MAPSTRRTAQRTPVPHSVQSSDFEVPSDEDVIAAEAARQAAHVELEEDENEDEDEAAGDAVMEDIEAEEEEDEDEVDPGEDAFGFCYISIYLHSTCTLLALRFPETATQIR